MPAWGPTSEAFAPSGGVLLILTVEAREAGRGWGGF